MTSLPRLANCAFGYSGGYGQIKFLLLGCSTAKFRSLRKRQPHSPDSNHCVSINFLCIVHQEPHNEVGSLSLGECLVGFEPGIF